MSFYVTSPEGRAALNAVFRRSHALYEPPPVLSLSEWADQYAYIPPEAGAMPGKFFTASAEYQRGMQDAITDKSIETVVLMMCSQSGKTQTQLNAIGYYSHYEPSPILFVAASEGEAEKFSKNRVAKMIRSTPVLRKVFPSQKTRDSGNTLLNKEFTGGVLVLAGANAPAGLASMPIRILMPDEVDRYPESSGNEGDPVDIAEKRTTTFWNRKHILASTPGIKTLSRIEKAYDESDRRKYFVPCPHCQTMQPLEWRRLQYTQDSGGRVTDVFYACTFGCEIRERSKHEMIRRGRWQATGQAQNGKTAGFHLNALYPPWLRWSDLVNEWLAAKKSLERRKTFINTRLAETWEIRGKGADLHELERRKDARSYREQVPAGVLVITAGVDVQDDRLEASLIGWGMDEERWVLDHQVFRGDPSLPETVTGPDRTKVRNEMSPWAALEDYLREPHDHERGVTIGVSCALIDSGGHHTARVYEFTKKNAARRWHAIIGRSGIGKPIVSKGSEQGPSHAMLYTVGTDTAKEDIYTSFGVAQPGPAYCHFSDSLDAEYFRQVTSEQLVPTKKDFVTTLKWVKKGERNEALDCFVYARAALAVLKPKYRRIAESLESGVARIARIAAAQSDAEQQQEPEEPGKVAAYQAEQAELASQNAVERRRQEKAARKGLNRKRGGWVNSW